MNQREFARIVLVSTVAVVIGGLFYLWAELNWKNLASRAAVFGATRAGAALGAVWAWRVARRPTPIDWIHEVVRTAMLAAAVGAAGALVAYLGDVAVPGQARFGNNEPKTWTPRFHYNDERHIAVVGRDASERDIGGKELFVRVVGTPLERARAACEILLADRCEAPLAYPSQLAGVAAGLPSGGTLVPRERSGSSLFSP